MPVKPPAPKHTSQDFSDKLIVTIPSGRYWFAGVVRCLYLAFNLLAEGLLVYFLIGSLLSDERPPVYFTFFMVAAIAIFTAFTIAYGYAAIWEFNGRETVEVANRSLILSGGVLGRRSAKEYSADSIKDLRAVPSNVARNRPGVAWINSAQFPMPNAMGGSLAFDYGAKTIRFGSGVDEAEAKQILAEIFQKFPQYHSDDFSRS